MRRFFDQGKPVAAICHGPWTLIDAGVAEGRRMTSYPSIKSDLRNAGAEWVDAEVVVDGGLVTSRKPDDIPAFNRKMLEVFREAGHAWNRLPKLGRDLREWSGRSLAFLETFLEHFNECKRIGSLPIAAARVEETIDARSGNHGRSSA